MKIILQLVILFLFIIACIILYRFYTKPSPKWIILQYDDRKIKEIYKPLIERNKKYCKMNGYQHTFVKSGYDHLPPYWRKVQLTIDTLNTNPSCKGVMWLDTDAAVADYNKTIEGYMKPEKSMYIARQSNEPFNSGVWFVRNDLNGHEIMKSWLESYKETEWVKNGSSWQTSGPFGGSNYEQGSFIQRIYPRYIQETEYYEWPVLQSQVPSDEVFTVHFYGGQDDACKVFTDRYGV